MTPTQIPNISELAASVIEQSLKPYYVYFVSFHFSDRVESEDGPVSTYYGDGTEGVVMEEPVTSMEHVYAMASRINEARDKEDFPEPLEITVKSFQLLRTDTDPETVP